jgi:hypothetical protein
VSGDADWRGACAAGCRIDAQTTSGDLRVAVGPAGSFDVGLRVAARATSTTTVGTTVSTRERHPNHVQARWAREKGASSSRRFPETFRW